MSCFYTNNDRIIDVEPLGGTDVRKCLWEAMEIVRLIGGKVRFKHNGQELVVDETTKYADLYKKWESGIYKKSDCQKSGEN